MNTSCGSHRELIPIILADDDAALVRLIGKHLRDAGYTVLSCSNGNDAFDLVGSRKPVILLADWDMPEPTGADLCRKARAAESGELVYSILLTGRGDPEHIAVGLEAGADDYLVKPAHPMVLLARVRAGERVLRLRIQQRAYAQALESEISERKRGEEELQRAHAETEQLLASISSILIGVNTKGRITRWNATAERVFGIEAKDAVGRLFHDVGIDWDHAAVAKSLSECRTRNRPARLDDVRFKRPDGKDGFLDITLNPVGVNSGRPGGFLLVAADITEQKILQGQLAQAQKLESIGQLAAGIAHEINTPTQFVSDNIRFFRDAFEDLRTLLGKCMRLLEAARSGSLPSELVAEAGTAAEQADVEYLMGEIPKAIDQSLEGVERVAKIVRSMKEFSHPGGEEKQAIDLNRAIESTITVARNEWKYVAEMVTDFDPSLPPVPCLVADFNQVILNMIINAAHAIADVVGDNTGRKGTITMTTRHDGHWAEIRIRDTGMGIPAEARSRIFDPFFTTKEVGKGTGQGLAIAHAVVVKKHGGSIDFESELGKGTTFIIRLPIELEPDNQGRTACYEKTHSLCG